MTGKESAVPSDRRAFWKGCYGKEPFDLRLTLLRLYSRLPVIVLVTLLGVLLFGGGYYVKNVLLRSRHFYAATSVYRVEYAADTAEELQGIFINQASWNTYVRSDLFVEMIQGHLAGGMEISDQELKDSLEAFVWSDLRVPAITVTTADPEKSEQVARAVETVMTRDLEWSEIRSVTVVDSGAAEEVLPDVRVGRAVLLSALLSCFFAVVCFLLKETGDDSIWLPGSIWKRYGVRTVGTLESRGLEQNLQYFFQKENSSRATAADSVSCGTAERLRLSEAGEHGESEQGSVERVTARRGSVYGSAEGAKVAVCVVQESMKPEKILASLGQRCPECVDETWFAVESPLTDPGVCDELRNAAGILLAVKVGCHAGRKLEYVLEYLEQQDCAVTAVLLWEADEKLIRRYYFLEGAGKQAYPGGGEKVRKEFRDHRDKKG